VTGLGAALGVLANAVTDRLMGEVDKLVLEHGGRFDLATDVDDEELRRRMAEVAGAMAEVHVRALAGEDVRERQAILAARRANLKSAASSHGLALLDQGLDRLLSKALEAVASV
jgi:hypothetical protein